MEDEITVVGQLRGTPDEDYVGLFDGHGGNAAAIYAARHLHEVRNLYICVGWCKWIIMWWCTYACIMGLFTCIDVLVRFVPYALSVC